jgi:alkylation response protein AidB-like acyl-CoA dehydrogenase
MSHKISNPGREVTAMSHFAPAVPDWPSALHDDTDGIALDKLTELAEADAAADEAATWPEALWDALVASEATRWSIPHDFGGIACDRATHLIRYARIAESSLTAAFILTQHDAAVRRLAAAVRPESEHTVRHWLSAVASGRAFTTVGISQLTTSRRHGSHALVATESGGGGYRLDGVMPWVTGANRADLFVTGAVTMDGSQLLIALRADREGVVVREPFPLAALQASCTSEVACADVAVEPSEVLAGPATDVLTSPGTAGTGGLETSALALGQARAALLALVGERERRADLDEPVEALAASWHGLAGSLLAAAHGHSDAPLPGQIRAESNGLVLRITQAYLAARKGTGFLRTDPAQRWARQALFFLVWSCPAPVAQAAIRDLAGLCG